MLLAKREEVKNTKKKVKVAGKKRKNCQVHKKTKKKKKDIDKN